MLKSLTCLPRRILVETSDSLLGFSSSSLMAALELFEVCNIILLNGHEADTKETVISEGLSLLEQNFFWLQLGMA